MKREYDGAYAKARLVALERQPGENHPSIAGADGRAARRHRDGGMRAGGHAASRGEVAP